MVLLALAAVLTAACDDRPQDRDSPLPHAAAPTADTAQPGSPPAVAGGDLRLEPACKPFIDIEGQIVVGGRPTDLKVDREGGLPKIQTYGWADGLVLVALKTDWIATPRARPEGRLSQVDCRTGARTAVYDEAGADLGNTVVAQDGRHLYFSGARGLSMLDTHTARTTLLAVAPGFEPACAAALADPDARARDLPVSLSRAGDRLVFHRGGPCGASGQWTAQQLELRGPTSGVLGTVPNTTAVHRPHPVSTLVGDKSNTLWLGDAGRCDEPGVQDPATTGAIWRSDNGGAQWKRVPVSDAKSGPMATAAKTIWTDLAKPGHLLVYGARCTSGDSVRGGSAFRSEDRGATWKLLEIPRVVEPATVGQNILGVRPKGGSLDRLFIWTQQGLFRTRNGGETWFPVADDADDHPGAAPSEPPRYAQIDGFIFRATDDGMVRRERATRRIDRLFPPPEK